MATRRQRAARAMQDDEPGLGYATTLIVMSIVIASALLTWAGKLDGQAFVAIVSGIIGGVLVSKGAHVGSKASVDPPPDA